MAKSLNSSFGASRFVKRNFILNVFDGAIFAFGMAIVAQNTVIPVFIKTIGGSSIAIGLIPVVWTIGFNFPQIIIANYARHVKRKKDLLLVTGFFQRVFWLILGLFTYYLLEKLTVELGVILFFVLFGLAAIGGGFNLPGWFDLISKITPVKLRGRLFALRVTLGALLGIFGGYLVKFVLEYYPYPENFTILFLAAFIVIMISYALLFFLKEEEPSKPKRIFRYSEYIRLLPAILKNNINFRNFLIGDAMMIVAFSSFAFFTVDALEKFSLPDSIAGEFTIVAMMSMVLGSFLFGYLSDNLGHKLNLVLMALFTLLSYVLAVTANDVFYFYLVFVFSAFATALIQVSRLTIVAEMCDEDDRPVYAALTNMITVPFTLSGILGGWIAYLFGYTLVFIITAIVSTVALLWLIIMVREPRRIII